MRVTEALVYNRIAKNTERARAQLDEASRPLMSGQLHASPSEDPTYTQKKTQIERALQRSGQYRNNIGRVQTYHQIVETTISNVTSALEDMSALAVSMSSTTADASGRKAAAAHVKAAVIPAETAKGIPALRTYFNLEGLKRSQTNLEIAFHIFGPGFNPKMELDGMPSMGDTIVSGADEVTSDVMKVVDLPRQILLDLFKIGGGIVGAGGKKATGE